MTGYKRLNNDNFIRIGGNFIRIGGNFIRIGGNFDFLYHFNIKYNFVFKDKEYKGHLYYFNIKDTISENNKSLMIDMFGAVLKYIQDNHQIKTKKGEQLEIGINFEKKGKLGFKEIEDEFLRKLNIRDNRFKWC